MFRYRMVSHTADIRVRVSSPTLEGLFQGAALSLCSLHVDRRRVREREAVEVSAEGYDMEDLLFNFLRECFSLIAVESFVYRRADVRIEDGGRVGATLRGEKHDPERHGKGEEIKAVTYHGLSIERKGGVYSATFILDV